MTCAHCGDTRGPLGPDDQLPACEDVVACEDRIQWARIAGITPPCDLIAGIQRSGEITRRNVPPVIRQATFIGSDGSLYEFTRLE